MTSAWIVATGLVFGAEIKSLPTPGNAVGIVIADQPGRWLVITVDRTSLVFSFPQIRLLDGGKVCAWEGKAGSYGVVFFAEDGSQQTTNIVLGGSSTSPPVPPPVPEGLWSLTSISHRQIKASSVPAAQISKVAENYLQVASRLKSGAIQDANAAKTELKTSNREDVPEADRAAWSGWASAIEAVLVAHASELTKDLKLLALAYEAIADGLILTGEVGM